MVPGLVLVFLITAAAYGLRQIPGMAAMSPMITAIFVGILFANLTTVPAVALPGIALCGKKLLRMSVALLGLQLTLGQVANVGIAGMSALCALVVATYGFTLLAGRMLGVDSGLVRLLAAGTSICGASAVAAANAVEKARDEDVSYAIACVTLFGTLAMLLYPLAASLLGLSGEQYGFWTGASVHEVAQVVAAGFSQGEAAGEYSVIVKLSRVLLLAPMLIGVTLLARRHMKSDTASLSAVPIVPGFVLCFILAIVLNSFGLIPDAVRQPVVAVTPVLLTAALSALGLGTRYGSLKAQGLRPLVLAAMATFFIAFGGLALTELLG